MSILAQGTQIYALVPTIADPAKLEVIEIECATAFSPGGNPADQIETTCLSAMVRSYMRGLRTPGQASLTLNADPRNESHVRLYQLSEDDTIESVHWVVGWSDGKDIPPTLSTEGDDFVLPKTRTWFVFDGYVSDFPFDFAANTVVTTAATIQRSGGSAWIRKVAV
ncbi:phage tail tube protein [Pseudomonas sp. RTC3]|uniref:phage tail tube protein n=1 Tax=unclassified Pseudomonas TaxID=196821 RepID=UPI002AB444E0|nr:MULTISPECIES: phage tail tube protein [unclassified Pseudomonas]MEB0062454.1 phage tail tube protein [Pseudomonas sp. RTC3]MDY7565785.1 phage tail tube protein [Pseudomonas sp. 5C2]MEB0027598.1 phage tail tube protein [Pseudomonas sp. MH9.2]MEB0240459.1 phage tail tube protein [Pseudomonas sp. 5C2]WPX70344.1 phage tail tube protein [Pseudomonas sp. MH9.2]